ncbi:MAG: four helix bundle protein [Candidatus Cloacimonetes bacterium]|nr:four helix bundle protein [Candidatus Cloacimonadota bacterium]
MHKDLEAWKLGIELLIKIYEVTSQFPTSEQFCLRSQTQEASVFEDVEKLHRSLLNFIKFLKNNNLILRRYSA